MLDLVAINELKKPEKPMVFGVSFSFGPR